MSKTLNQTGSIKIPSKPQQKTNQYTIRERKWELFKICVMHLYTLIVLIFRQFIYFIASFTLLRIADKLFYGYTHHHHLSKILSLFLHFNSFFISNVNYKQKQQQHKMYVLRRQRLICTENEQNQIETADWSSSFFLRSAFAVSMRQLMCGFQFS